MKNIRLLFFLTLFLGCDASNDINSSKPKAVESIVEKVTNKIFTPSTVETKAPPIVKSAREQIGKTIIYDPKYVGLSYPNGDIPLSRGVCTDVVIRAMRDSFDVDLQKEVHEDMKRAFSTYPKIWGAKRTDKTLTIDVCQI